MGKLLHEAFPRGSSLDVLPFTGAVGNMKLLAQGDADLALSFNTVSRWALRGLDFICQGTYINAGWLDGSGE